MRKGFNSVVILSLCWSCTIGTCRIVRIARIWSCCDAYMLGSAQSAG